MNIFAAHPAKTAQGGAASLFFDSSQYGAKVGQPPCASRDWRRESAIEAKRKGREASRRNLLIPQQKCPAFEHREGWAPSVVVIAAKGAQLSNLTKAGATDDVEEFREFKSRPAANQIDFSV